MKKMKNVILSIVLMFLIASCATTTTIKFPVSTVAPAAEITATKKKDKNNNFVISITANYLASVERLTPPKKTYVVWISTKDNGLKNIGRLKNENAKKSTLETLSAFDPVEIFITAEDDGNISYPTGAEISRGSFKK